MWNFCNAAVFDIDMQFIEFSKNMTTGQDKSILHASVLKISKILILDNNVEVTTKRRDTKIKIKVTDGVNLNANLLRVTWVIQYYEQMDQVMISVDDECIIDAQNLQGFISSRKTIAMDGEYRIKLPMSYEKNSEYTGVVSSILLANYSFKQSWKILP